MAIPSNTGVGKRRWGIGALLGIGVLINYIDRIGLSVAAPQIKDMFQLTPVELGLLFSAFAWSYSLLQIPVGMVIDRFGPTKVGRWGAFLWGVASVITAFSSGFAGIFFARILLGVAEAPAFPVSSKATGYWFPRHERGLATAIFDAAAKFSNVIGVPLVAITIVAFGWRWGFGLTAFLSFQLLFRLLLHLPRPERRRKTVQGRAELHPAKRRRAGRQIGRWRHEHAGLPADQDQSLGPDHRLCRLWLHLLPVPDLAARLPGPDHAHEYPGSRLATLPFPGPLPP
ncbi:MFS transporter [Massilia sp. H-1]|nr:MFS transporter [Massilia sp. H-1]